VGNSVITPDVVIERSGTLFAAPHRMHPLVHPQRDHLPPRLLVRLPTHPSSLLSILSVSLPPCVPFLRERRALFSIGDNSTPFLTSNHLVATPARHFILVYPGRHSAPAERLTHWR